MTRVAILWHMHQPFYQDLVTGEHILPWVRMHALKDYYGMVALLREFPTVKVTFNLVPSMLVQLEAFARAEARDRYLEVGLKPAEALTEDERAFAIEHFFHAHRPRMIDPYPRYADLFAKRGLNGGVSPRIQAAQFSVAEIRDLQVWHKLVWLDPFYLDRDPRVRALLDKGRDFSEEDKATLRIVELQILQRVIPEYSEAAARGQVELSTSPFFHPILPLLCDTDVYLRTHPQSRMPRERFRRPDDAYEQLVRAVAYHERLFGRRPHGLWPSEGSVSDDMVPLVARAGFRWMATDEEILARTLGRSLTRDGQGTLEQPEVLYKPYIVGKDSQAVACAFRDHTISDLIGFSYASWAADAAADDFVRRLTEAGRRFTIRTGGQTPTIAVILDGENAWEHYEHGGRPFLRALYGRLANDPDIRTVTMGEACATAVAADALPSIFPGSWINADFYIWIGHADDHRAWSQLAEARRALDAATGVSQPALARALDEMLIAEGSDWFWWYGDDHSSEHDLEFDDLFRRHVRNVYRAIEKPIPEELFLTNITTMPPTVEISQPTGFLRPVIDGEVTSYFEWIGAGCVETGGAAGAMHQVSDRDLALTSIQFGFDLDNFYLRVEGSRTMASLLGRGLELSVNFLKPAGLRLAMRLEGDKPEATLVERDASGRWVALPCAGLRVAVRRIAEVQVPFKCLRLETQAPVAFIVGLYRGASEIEHHPRLQPIEFEVPDRNFPALNWTA
ncbi:MAG TPA: glycoside hydrolase family 57 protein [Vicinamibacterales bacterium]|jgi:alpha-amylase/alpha-mannosidase (GH57 family)|nr:glycoside hydrolase family 57 protein [Vicinamibacterales bacterium]